MSAGPAGRPAPEGPTPAGPPGPAADAGDAGSPAERRGLRFTFRSLRDRNYRLYFFGQMGSMCGTWTQTVAMAWLVLKITGSGTQVGLVTAVAFIPTMLLGAWGGVVADRFDNRHAVMAVQTLLGVQAAVLAALTLSGVVQLWMLYVLAVVQGVGVALDFPTRQAFLSQLAPPAFLANAVALNAGVAQLARIVGPAVAGLLIITVGTGVCFAVNAASYVVLLVLLAFMDVSALRPRPRLTTMKGQVRAGVRYAWRRPELRTLLAVVVVFAVFGGNFNVLLPLLAKDAFNGSAGLYGAMGAVLGVGAVLATLIVASRPRPTKRSVVLAFGALGLSLVLSALAGQLWLEMAALALAGLTSVAVGVSINASLQLGANPAMRGRVVALFFLIANGSNVIGGPMSGWLAETFGVRWSMGVNAVVTSAAAVALLAVWRRRLGEPSAITDTAPVDGPAATAPDPAGGEPEALRPTVRPAPA